jgi:hypothetical protein
MVKRSMYKKYNRNKLDEITKNFYYNKWWISYLLFWFYLYLYILNTINTTKMFNLIV